MAPRKPRCDFGKAKKDDTKEVEHKEIEHKEIEHKEGDHQEGDIKEADHKEDDNKVTNKRQPCKELAQRFVGHCTFCSGDFCSKHRMLEAHNCTGLEDCKKESHARNADKLNSERTLIVKGL